MTRLESALIRLDTDLRELSIRWALIGGLAVSARAEPRTTRDLDVAIAVHGDREAEGLVRELRGRGYSDVESGVFEQKAMARLATVRLLSPGEPTAGGVIVDLLFASSGIEAEVVAAAQQIEILPGFAVPVATTGHLLALKVLALRPERPQDLNDALALRAVADPEEIQQGREALVLIARRGYDRGKDLQAELGRVLAQRLEEPEYLV